MNLLKLQTYGFKSFADKLEIEFGNGITAVVGPNGCGKSNVSDVIRWILGEQSARQLRGKNMQDLIFGGTEKRKSMSYCEGSMHFDNTNKLFPLDYDEVVISRKLYRSGESEYLINRRPARLKEIQDLLRDVGLGRDGYSVVGQGRMDAILNAKPEDRRAIFEEALGISKFRVRKNETERKLERTAANMDRVGDIMSVLEKRIPTLEKQSADAKQYLSLRDELRYHDVNAYIYAYDNSSSEKQKHLEKAKGLSEEIAEKEARTEKLRERYDELLRLMADADRETELLTSEATQLKIELERKAGQHNLLVEKLRNVRLSKETNEREILAAESEIKISIETVRVLSERIEALERRKSELLKQRDRFVTKIEALRSEIDEKREKLREKSDGTLSILDEVTAMRSSLASALSEKTTLSQRLAEISAEEERIRGKMTNLSKDEKQLFDEYSLAKSRKNELYGKIISLKEKSDAIRNENSTVVPELNRLSEEKMRLKTNYDMLRGISERYEGYNQTVKLLMRDAQEHDRLRRSILGVVAELLRVPEKYEIAIETALGGAMQNIVTETDADAAFLIEYLKSRKYGRLTFLPLSTVKVHNFSDRKVLREKGVLGIASEVIGFDEKYYPVVANLLGSTLVVDTMKNAVEISRRYKYGFRIVTLEGEILSPQGSLTGGSHRSKEYNILSTDRMLSECKAQLEDVSEKLDLLKGDYENKQVERKALDTERETLTQEYSLLNASVAAMEEKISGFSALSDNERNLSTQLKAERLQKTARMEILEKECGELSGKIETLNVQRRLHEELSGKDEEAYQALSAEKDKLMDEFSAVKESLAQVIAAVDNARAEIEVHGKRAEMLKESKTEKQVILVTLDKQIEALEAEIYAATGDDELQIKLSKVETEIKGSQERKEQRNAEFSRVDGERTVLSEELLSLRQSLDRESFYAERVEQELYLMQEKIMEEYGLTYSAALAFKDEDYDTKTTKKETNRIRNAINKLGPVNVNAIDEYKTVKEEFDSNTLQMEDLKKASDDLKKIIAELTEEMVTRFNSGFITISNNFTEIFKELFGGGKATMSIDRGEGVDPLDFGIEIEAQPPGKKLQNISLLSGGERALTCIAILFAILKLSPMPFCVLDEIEAPLDDANAERVAKYLRRYSDETQFIVITHKKPTMESADRLFGVTMQEKGVSKIVSVQLTEAVQHVQ